MGVVWAYSVRAPGRAPGGSLCVVWASSGRLLGASPGRLLGASWVLLGVLWPCSGRLLAALSISEFHSDLQHVSDTSCFGCADKLCPCGASRATAILLHRPLPGVVRRQRNMRCLRLVLGSVQCDTPSEKHEMFEACVGECSE